MARASILVNAERLGGAPGNERNLGPGQLLSCREGSDGRSILRNPIVPVLAFLIVPVVVPASVQAADWRLGLEALTDVPLEAGGRVWAEAPYGIHLDTSLGAVPAGYVSLLNDIVVGAGGYNEETAAVIEGVISSSLVWRIHLGWRPSADWGFYLAVGYGLVSLGGSVEVAKLLLAATGQKLPVEPPDVTRPYRVASTLHMIDAEIGYMWAVLDDHLTLRLSLGFAGTLNSVTTVEPQFQPVDPAGVKAWTRTGAQYLDGVYTSYLFLPLLSFAIGYRFF